MKFLTSNALQFIDSDEMQHKIETSKLQNEQNFINEVAHHHRDRDDHIFPIFKSQSALQQLQYKNDPTSNGDLQKVCQVNLSNHQMDMINTKFDQQLEQVEKVQKQIRLTSNGIKKQKTQLKLQIQQTKNRRSRQAQILQAYKFFGINESDNQNQTIEYKNKQHPNNKTTSCQIIKQLTTKKSLISENNIKQCYLIYFIIQIIAKIVMPKQGTKYLKLIKEYENNKKNIYQVAKQFKKNVWYVYNTLVAMQIPIREDLSLFKSQEQYLNSK